MTRRTKRRTVSPEVEAAHITARATEASAMITASATVASAKISASATRSAARMTGMFGLIAAGLAGVLTLALGTTTLPSSPPEGAVGSGPQYQGSDSREVQAAQALDERERDAVLMQLRFSEALEADCTLYESHDKRADCINKKAWARNQVNQMREQLTALRQMLSRISA